jgi:hypothetical protein
MKANEDQPGPLVTRRRARRGAFRLALVVSVCSVGLHVAPGRASEPLDCNPMYPQINIHDDRSVAPGTFCALYTVDIHSPGSLTNAGTLFNFQRVVNHDGGILLNAATGVFWNTVKTQLINDGSVQNFGTLTNDGASWGHAEIINGGAFSNYGTLTNGNYGVLTNSGSFVNQGGDVKNFGQMASYGTIVNQLHGVLVNFGTLQSSALQNLIGAQLINQGTLVSFGSFNNMQATVQNSGHLTNASTLTNLMGTITNVGDLDNLGTLRNRFEGTLTNVGSLSNSGSLRNEAGARLTNFGSLSNLVSLRNESGATLTNFTSLSNVGTLRNEAGATLTNHGTLKVKAGTLTNDGTLTNAPSGTVTNHGRFDNRASGSFDNAGTFRNEATFTNAGTLVSTGRIQGSGFFTQTAGATTVQGELSQGAIRIEGGTLAGSGHVTSDSFRLGAGAVLSPGEEPGDIGSFVIDATIDELFGSLDLDIDSLGSFDALGASGNVWFDGFGSTSFNFYFGNNTNQRDGDTFDFFTAGQFLHFEALNFRCHGLAPGFGCALDEINGGRGLRLALTGPSGSPVDVPEPGGLGILGLGLVLLGGGLGLGRYRDRDGGLTKA